MNAPLAPQTGRVYAFPRRLENARISGQPSPSAMVFLRLESARIPVASLPCRGWRDARSARARATLIRGFPARQFPAPMPVQPHELIGD